MRNLHLTFVYSTYRLLLGVIISIYQCIRALDKPSEKESNNRMEEIEEMEEIGAILSYQVAKNVPDLKRLACNRREASSSLLHPHCADTHTQHNKKVDEHQIAK